MREPREVLERWRGARDYWHGYRRDHGGSWPIVNAEVAAEIYDALSTALERLEEMDRALRRCPLVPCLTDARKAQWIDSAGQITVRGADFNAGYFACVGDNRKALAQEKRG